MRSYIFTDRERAILRKWLKESLKVEGADMIFHRIRTFRNLEEDVEIYLEVKDVLKQISSSR